ncbi:MAG: phosphoethanolamine transferase [Steroidobacteraceae bacterium]
MPKRARYACLALIALSSAPALAAAICASKFHTARSVVSVLLTTAVEAVLIAALTRTWRRFFVVNFPLFVVGLVFALYTVQFGVPPGRLLALIVVNTTWEEVTGFLELGRGTTLALLIALPLVYAYLVSQASPLPMFARKPAGATARISFSRLLLLACLFATAYVAGNPDEMIDGAAYNPLIGTAMFLAAEIPRARADASGAHVAKIAYRARLVTSEEVHILVIGESARRDSWSAYGYTRSTTPHLDELRQEVIFLQNAVADANMTSWSVPIILTGSGTKEMLYGRIRGNLLDLAHEAGYNTAWLVNQDAGISAYVGIHADRETYIPQINAGFFGRRALDETLLPAFRQEIALSRFPRFIGIHTMGSHWPYEHRYPPNFRHFGNTGADVSSIPSPGPRHSAGPEIGQPPQARPLGKGTSQETNAYDDSVLYTDWFLSEIIEHVRALSVPATVTFFPDHGEDLLQLDGVYGHAGPAYTRHAFEIPAFVWLSDAYRKAYPQKVAAIQKNASKEIRSHDVFATEADLMGIQYSEAVAQRSFASEQFLPDTRMQHIAGGSLVNPPRPTARAGLSQPAR